MTDKRRIIVPYTSLNPWVKQALERENAEFIKTDEEFGYWKLLDRLWEEKQTFIINEHDKLPWHGALDELWNCPMPWCAYSYHRHVSPTKEGVGDYHGFGCVKFSKELIERIPNVWKDMENRHYSQVDTHFEWYTWQNSIRVHQHRPAINHLHSV